MDHFVGRAKIQSTTKLADGYIVALWPLDLVANTKSWTLRNGFCDAIDLTACTGN